MLVLFQGLQTIYHCYWQYVGLVSRFTDNLSLLLTICWSCFKVYRQFIIAWQYVGLVSRFTDSLSLLLTICWSCFKVYVQFIIVIGNMLVFFQGLQTVYHCYWQYVGLVSRFTDSLSLLLTICWSSFKVYRQFIIVVDNMLVLFQGLQTVYHCYWQYVGIASRFKDNLSLLLTICWSCFKVYRQFIIVIDNMLVLFQGLQTVYHCLTICWSCFKVYRQFIIVIGNMLVFIQGLQTVYHYYWQYVGLVSRFTYSLSLLLTICWSCFKVYRQFIIVIDNMLVLFQGLQTVYHCYWQYVGLVSRFTDSLSLLLTICGSCFKVYGQFIIVIDNRLLLFQGLQTVYHCYWQYISLVSRFTHNLSLLLTICWSCFKVYRQFIIVIDNMLVLFQGLQTVYHCLTICWSCFKVYRQSIIVIDNMLVLFQGLQTVYHCYWQYVGPLARFTDSLSLLLTICWSSCKVYRQFIIVIDNMLSSCKVYRQFIIVIDNMLVLFQGLQTVYHCYWQYVGLVSRFTDSLSLLLTICWSCFKVYRQFIIVIDNMLVLFQGLQTVYHCYWQYVDLVSRFTDSFSLLLTTY